MPDKPSREEVESALARMEMTEDTSLDEIDCLYLRPANVAMDERNQQPLRNSATSGETTLMTIELNLKEKGSLVESFWRAVEHGGASLEMVPDFVHRILETGAWRERVYCGELFRHKTFLSFITTPPLAGCGWPPEKVEVLLRDDKAVLEEWHRATTAEHGGDRKSAHIKTDNVSLDPKYGNSLTYTLTRLKQQDPELFKRVTRGELSANAAAIQAGFRRKPSALEQIRKLLPKLTLGQRALLIRDLIAELITEERAALADELTAAKREVSA